MKAKIEIRMENEAFDGNEGGETARILRELADKIQGQDYFTPMDEYTLRDINGNKVGLFRAHK